MVRNSFVLCFINHHALLTGSFYIIVWTLPAEPSCLCPEPRFLEVMKSKHGDILVLPEYSTDDDGCWNAEKMVNQTESYRLFNNAISLCSFFGTCSWDLQPRENHLQRTARNMDEVEQRMVFLHRC